MLLFVYGDDGARVAEKVKQLRTHFVTKIDTAGMNLAEFPAPGSAALPYAEVLQAVQSAPFLAEKRMVIVRGLCETKKAEAKQWVEGLQRVPDSTILVLVDVLEAKNVEKHDVYTGLKAVAEVHHYPMEKLAGAQLETLLVERAKRAGSSMDRKAAQELIMRVGDDPWRLQHEVDKLAAYAGSDGISSDVVHLLTASDAEGNIFGFVDAVAKGEPKAALKKLADERLAGSADLYILAMLARHVRIVLQIRAALDEGAGGEKALGLHPYVLQKTIPQARQTPYPTLCRWHELLTKLDRDAKRGAVDPALAVDRFVAELLTK